MKNVIAFALSLAIISPAFAQKDKPVATPKNKKKDEKKFSLSVGFGLGSGLFIKLETVKAGKKNKPKKMVQVHHVRVPAPLPRVVKPVSATKATGKKSLLPSPMHCVDDVQYYPPSTETPLPNARRAHQEFRLKQNAKPKKLMKLNHVITPAPSYHFDAGIHPLSSGGWELGRNSSIPITFRQKPALAAAAPKTALACPDCPTVAKNPIQRVRFVKAPSAGVIVIQTKITETDKTGKKKVLAAPKMVTKPGQKASMEIVSTKDGIKIEIVAHPLVNHPGHIVIKPVLHKMDKHGQMKVVAKPTIMTKTGVPAKVMIGTKNHSNIEMEIVADHLTVHPKPQALNSIDLRYSFGMHGVDYPLGYQRPEATMLMTTNPIFGWSKNPVKTFWKVLEEMNPKDSAHHSHGESNSLTPVLSFRFNHPANSPMLSNVFRNLQIQKPNPAVPFGVTIIGDPKMNADMLFHTLPGTMMPLKPAKAISDISHNTRKNQMCESCKTAAMAKCSCCGKLMAAKAMMPNIMQAGFARVNSNEMTVKVYPFLKELEQSEITELFLNSNKDNAKKVNSVIASLVETIQTSVSPESWKKNGGKASISFSWYGCCFVVRQNQQGHQELSKLLSQLERSMSDRVKAMKDEK